MRCAGSPHARTFDCGREAANPTRRSLSLIGPVSTYTRFHRQTVLFARPPVADRADADRSLAFLAHVLADRGWKPVGREGHASTREHMPIPQERDALRVTEEERMQLQPPNGATDLAKFAQRKLRPRACVIDVKEHMRTVLEDALENLGFITCECARAGELALVLAVHHPNLVVIGLSI